MKQGKHPRNTDVDNVFNELRILRKRIRDYEKIFQSLKKERYSLMNASTVIHMLHKKLSQCTCGETNE